MIAKNLPLQVLYLVSAKIIFKKKKLLDVINLNHSKLVDLGFHQLHIRMPQFQSECGILDQNDKKLKPLQMLASI